MEDFISYLDVEHFLELRGSDTFSSEGNKSQIILKNLIAKVIFKLQKNMSSEALKLYDKFCSSLHETDIIISFNYDTLIEDSLYRINKPFRLFPYRFKSVSDSGGIEVVLLKMHGSINWFDKTCYNEMYEAGKRGGGKNPYNAPGNIFSNPARFHIKKLLKGPFFKGSPLNDIYVLNNLEEYFNAGGFFLLSNSPLIISPSFVKTAYLNPIKSFWEGFNNMGALNRSLNIIGFSFPTHDKYLLQPLVNTAVNFQSYNKFNQLHIAKKYKKQKMRVIDLQKNEKSKADFQKKLQFIDWEDSIFLSDGFGKKAIHEIFSSESG